MHGKNYLDNLHDDLKAKIIGEFGSLEKFYSLVFTLTYYEHQSFKGKTQEHKE